MKITSIITTSLLALCMFHAVPFTLQPQFASAAPAIFPTTAVTAAPTSTLSTTAPVHAAASAPMNRANFATGIHIVYLYARYVSYYTSHV
jgi:hypothetical protein